MTDHTLARLGPRDAGPPAQPVYNRDQIDLLKRTIATDTTDDEFSLFMEVARRRGLDPFSGQIHAVRREGKLSIQTGIDGFRSLAAETGRYGGQLADEWCGPDGVWVDVWLKDEPPAAARARVVHLDHPQADPAVAKYSEYVQRNRDGAVNKRWAQAPAAQLAKCAAALAFRREFPQQLGGMYTDDEMGQADNPPTATVTVGTPAVTIAGEPFRGEVRSSARRVTREPPPLAPDGPASIATWQIKKIMGLFSGADVKDRDERLTIAAHILGRELAGQALTTTKDLTADEADLLIAGLDRLIYTGPTLRAAYAADAAQAEVDSEGAAADARAAEQEAAHADGADVGEGERLDARVFDQRRP